MQYRFVIFNLFYKIINQLYRNKAISNYLMTININKTMKLKI